MILMTEKTQDSWFIGIELVENKIKLSHWETSQWQLKGFNISENDNNTDYIELNLYKDERTDYRFNLSSIAPKLFVILDNTDLNEKPKVQLLTASQSLAAQYMDADSLVLSADMPLVVQAWIEAFIGRHGELLEVNRKKRLGAGRANGN